MTDKVAIVNSALVQLGANTIASFEDKSLEATAAGAKWDIARRDLLRLHPWNFAIKRRELAENVTAPVYDYERAYTIPSECLKVLQVFEDSDYKLERRSILTDKRTCKIKYIFDNEEIAEWDATFVNLMMARMAYELAYTLPRSRPMIDTMYQLYREQLQIAKSYDAQEDIEDQVDQFLPDLISARFHGSLRRGG